MVRDRRDNMNFLARGSASASTQVHYLQSREPTVLLVAAKWWSLSARLAIALIHCGCRVCALCPAAHPLTVVSGMDRIRRYGGVGSMDNLQDTLNELRPDFIVPCDDGVVAQLHALHRANPSLRALIERSLGSSDGFATIDSRFLLLQAAARLGITVPATHRVTCAEDLAAWHETARTAVVKVTGETGGDGVRICGSLEESLAAWRNFSPRPSSLAAWKRQIIDRDPLALWAYRQVEPRETTVQRYIAGRPANLMMACREGEVLAHVSVLVVAADGPTGASCIVRRIHNDQMARAARLLARDLRLSGFYGLDFVIESQTSEPYLIEMNPRCTQLGHLDFADQGSLASALTAAWRREPASKATSPIGQRTIALFPAAQAHGISDDIIAASYHDVPNEEPRLVRELMLNPWPQRQWAARAYHLLRPIRRPQIMQFEDPEAPVSEAGHYYSRPKIA